MKIFNFLVVALVAMVGLNSCSKDCDHEMVEMDYSNDLVGTWTCLDADHAEALVFKAGGTFASYGVSNGEYSEELNATWVLKNNKLTLAAGDYKSNVVLEIIPGKSMALVDERGKRNVFEYCANDLADEVVGMWVCNDAKDDNMRIHSFDKNGTAVFTGWSEQLGEFSILDNANYKVVGDLIFQGFSNDENSSSKYIVARLIYTPDATTHGDIMTFKHYLFDGIESAQNWLRVKQSLNLANKSYDYNNLYLSNVKGKDQDINFWGYTMNLATMDGTGLDKMLKAILFHIEFPNANTISYTYTMGNNQESFSAPIKVEGNKLTVKMSDKVSTLKDIVYYAYQDADDSQMHLYMHRSAFVNFYTNMQALLLEGTDAQFDITNAEAIDAIYNSINDVVESINLSIVMSNRLSRRFNI